MQEVTVRDFYNSLKDHLGMELVGGEKGLRRKIKEPTLNRPGLALVGYYDFFPHRRIQVIGFVEMSFLKTLNKEERTKMIRAFFSKKVPCCIITRHFVPFKEMIEEADRTGVVLFRSNSITKLLINEATLYLEDKFSPQITMSGDLVEVYGIGILIIGESGVGKSECALSIVSKGHRLISDDIVIIKLRDRKDLIGNCAEVTKYHMEIRGPGIINIEQLFGAGSVREYKKIDMVVSLEDWDVEKEYDRVGIDENFFTILGIKLPYMVIPVKPGRDVALIIEVAALNHRLRKLGRNSAKDLNDSLIEKMTGDNKKIAGVKKRKKKR